MEQPPILPDHHAFVWTATPGRFATGETLRIGRVNVARWYRRIGSRGGRITYGIDMMLPGFKAGSFDHGWDEPEKAKAHAETAVRKWLGWIKES